MTSLHLANDPLSLGQRVGLRIKEVKFENLANVSWKMYVTTKANTRLSDLDLMVFMKIYVYPWLEQSL